MGTNPGVDVRIGWDESEQKEFLKALKQPLMVQTPLQLVIENLFQRLQAQATFIQQMKEKMERIAVKDVTADELLTRIKLLESKQGDAAGPKLNPFNQQEIITRLEALESKLTTEESTSDDKASRDKPSTATGAAPSQSAATTTAGAATASATTTAAGAAGAGPSPEALTDLEVRLQRLEKRLTGVYNLPGKLVALEQIASGLGVAVPDLEYPTGGGPPQPHPNALPAAPQLNAWRPPNGHLQPLDASPAGGADGWPAGFKGFNRAGSPGAGGGQVDLAAGLSGGVLNARGGSPSHSPRALGSPTQGGQGQPRLSTVSMGSPPGTSMNGAGLSSQKLVQLGQEVAAVRSENEALKESVESLTQQVAGLRTGLGANAVESLSRLQAVEENVGALETQVADLAASRREAAGRPSSDVTFADLTQLRSQVEASVAEAKAAAAGASAVAEKELPVLAARVEELAEGLRKKSEPRDIDALFHERINALEGSMGEMKQELLGSIEAAMEGAVKLDDLQALEELLEAKAPAEAVRGLAAQTHALGQAVAGISEVIATRPELGEALRAAAAGGGGGGGGGGGAVATKLRCLTCDQPIAGHRPGGGSHSAGPSMSTSTGRGSFLPRLESMPAKEGLPGGPGLMAAELRASKEERLAGLTGTGAGGAGSRGATLKAGELDEYATGGMGGMRGGGSPPRDVSPGRAVERSRAARVPVGGGKPGGPGHGGKPVFI